jgi:cytochrome c5
MKSGMLMGLVGLLVLAACGPKTGAMPGPLSVKQSTEAAGRWPGASDFSTARGRMLFQSKCDGCHGYPDVHAIQEASWPGIMERMGPKAELNAGDAGDVLNFVRAAALGER